MSIKEDKTWIYEKGQRLYVSGEPLEIKGSKELTELEKAELEDYQRWGYNPIIKYYLNGKCVYSCKRYNGLDTRDKSYLILRDKEFSMTTGIYTYYNYEELQFIPIAQGLARHLKIDILEHEDIYEESE